MMLQYKNVDMYLCFLYFQARNKQNGELAAIKVIKMEPGDHILSEHFS